VKFQTTSWALEVPSPWRITDAEHCAEVTQPEGIGALHISSYRKQEGRVTDSEALNRLKADCPDETDMHESRCGDFAGYWADYQDWHADAYWRKWILYCRSVLLFVSYTCKRGDKDLEADEVAKLLKRLRCTA
jgi:hypothetical protein